MLLLASVFSSWTAWAWPWPPEVLAVAMGFLLAAWYVPLIWLIIPVTIVGLSGLLLRFSALTGLRNAKAAAWIIEPLSVGLALLAVGAMRCLPGRLLAGIALVGTMAI